MPCKTGKILLETFLAQQNLVMQGQLKRVSARITVRKCSVLREAEMSSTLCWQHVVATCKTVQIILYWSLFEHTVHDLLK